MAMAISQADLLEAFANMTVTEVVDLIAAIEEKFGVTAAVQTVAVSGNTDAAPAQEEQTEFNVVMTSFGDNKIGVIKVVRELTGLGLKEAKAMVEGVPSTVKEAAPKAEAEDIKKKLEEAGAKAELK